MQVELQEKLVTEVDFSDVFVIILKDLQAPTFTLLGKEQHKWVESAVKSSKSVTVDYDGSEDVKQWVKPWLTNARYTMILFSNTPLFTPETFEDIKNFIAIKNIDACKLPSGYAFKTAYLKEARDIMFDSFYMQNEQDFYELETIRDLPHVCNILQKNILDNHFYNGVIFTNIANVYIEEEVSIGKGTVIGNGVELKGNSKIGKNCKLENTQIANSEIASNVQVLGGKIVDSVIFDNCVIEPFSYISNYVVEKNKIVHAHSRLKNDDLI